jgi:hypothetical protein
MEARCFLTDKQQLADFDRDQERFARHIRAWDQENSAPQSLSVTVADLARALTEERNHGFQGVGVAVDDGDGMTWSAYSVDRAIEDTLPNVPRVRLQGQAGVYGPELARVIPMRKIATAAQRHGLIKSVRLLGWRLTAVAVVVALAVGIAGAVLTALDSTSSTLTLRLVIFSAVTVALAMIGQLASQLIFPDFRDNTLAKVTDDLKDLEAAPVTDQYRAFVDEMAALLGRLAQFRCVIVDDYGLLDQTTRMVLDSYLRTQADNQRSELWVIFYSATDKSLLPKVTRRERSKPYGYRRIKLFQQEPLTELQRRQLAEIWEVSERSIFRTVRSIIQDPGGQVYLEELFGQVYRERRDPVAGKRAADSLDLFYLFAVNARCRRNPWLYDRDILANFSRERGLRSQVLQVLLSGRMLTRTTLNTELGKMRLKFFPLAGESASEIGKRRFRATADAGEMLEGDGLTQGKWIDFGLASPRLVHLFWVLYWSDTELNSLPDAFFVQEIVTHLLRSILPAELDTETVGENFPLNALAKELFEVAMQCLAACLRFCLLHDVPQLLDLAKELAEDGNREERRRRRRRLRRLAWQAYGLLGNESVLSVALDLEPAASAAVDHDSQSVLLDLFLDSMPGATPDRRQAMRSEFDRRDGRSVTSYAQVRAAWLAASIQPFLCPGTPTLSASADQIHDVLPGLLAAAVNALDSAVQDEWQATDILNISLGVWALAVSTGNDWSLTDAETRADRHAALIDTLNDCYILADDLAKQRRSAEPDSASLDLVADCLAEDLLTAVFTAALTLLANWPEFGGQPAPGWSDAATVAIESGHSLDIRVPIDLADLGTTVPHLLTTDAARCMGVLTVLWRSLGFDQQSSFMTIRRAQFVTLMLPLSPSVAEQNIQMLSENFGAPDHIGLLTLFTAAAGSRFSDQLASQMLLRCCATARRGRFGEGMVAEICFLALNASHAYRAGLNDPLEFLAGRRPAVAGNAAIILDDILANIVDANLARAALVLINSMFAMEKQNIVESVRAALDRRIEDIENAKVAAEINAYLRIFNIQRRLKAGEAVDITAELDAWEEMRDQASYTFVLYLLITGAGKQQWERIVSEAAQILPETGKYLNHTGYVLLAYELLQKTMTGQHSTAPDDVRIITAALRAGALAIERALTADTNIAVFRLLAISDPANSEEYERHQLQWEQVALELDLAQRLPRLVDHGQFFMLVWHYYQFFHHYGLRSEPPVPSYGLEEPQLSQELDKWRKNRDEIPDPVLPGPDNGPVTLSGEFLARGYALFFPPAADAKQLQALDVELEEGRHQYDLKAKSVIEVFYRILRSLPQIPRMVEQILGRHQDLVLARVERQDADSQAAA